MSSTDPSQLAESFVYLIQRFTGNSPDALTQMRDQIERERTAGREMMERAEAQLTALDQLQALIAKSDWAPDIPATLPLKQAIVRVLDEEPGTAWDRESLFAEVVRRGWGPGGGNPRNTFTARLRDLELEKRVRRIGRNMFASVEKEEVPAV